MIGDPSGKSAERNLLGQESVTKNSRKIRTQLADIFNNAGVKVDFFDNGDWFKEWSLVDFLRDVGKHSTVSYMLSKDSVDARLKSGLSFTEFSYQLLQAFDFLQMSMHGCNVQIGGSDQWGNITSGMELIRKKSDGDAHAITTKLMTKSDGTKFGKTATGENIWLDPSKTSPYKFYQFWLNINDEDAVTWIKSLSLLPLQTIVATINAHRTDPRSRMLHKMLAAEMTALVHSEETLKKVMSASESIFNGALNDLDKDTFLHVLDGVPKFSVDRSVIESGVGVVDFLTQTRIFDSKGSAIRMLDGGGLSVNRDRVDKTFKVDRSSVVHDEYILVKKGKKNHILCKLV
jgi:tyrosyl-tRNA synthetase